VFGSGNYLGIELNTSRRTAPWCCQHGRPVLHGRRHLACDRRLLPHQQALQQPGRQYQLATPGASIRFGVPFSEFDTVFFGMGVERTEIGASSAIPNSYFLYREQYGQPAPHSPADAGLGARRPRQPARAHPRAATSASTSSGASLRRRALPATNLQYQEYWPLPCADAGRERRIGIGKGLGGKPFPMFKNFYGGGLGTVRVFEQGSLGVIDPTGAYIGGAKRFNVNTELYFPCRDGQRQARCASLPSPTPATSGAKTRRSRRQPACLGGRGPELDLARWAR
jgi:outer membrane protein insertion porin family